MRTLLVVFVTLLALTLSLEAKKKKLPPSQMTETAKQHRAEGKKIVKSRKAPKHRQQVN